MSVTRQWSLVTEKTYPEHTMNFSYMTKTTCSALYKYEHVSLPYGFSLYLLENKAVALHCTHSFEFKEYCATKGIKSTGLASGPDNTYCVICPHHEKIVQLIEAIDHFTPLDDIKHDLFVRLGIRDSEQGISKKVDEAVQSGNHELAVNLACDAQDMGYHGVLWGLATQLHTKQLVEESSLIDIYRLITNKSKYYSEANERLYVLYEPKHFSEEMKGNPYYCLEMKLRAAYATGNVTLICQAMHSLIGNTGMAICEDNVGELLVNLGSQIRSLKQAVQPENSQNEKSSVRFF